MFVIARIHQIRDTHQIVADRQTAQRGTTLSVLPQRTTAKFEFPSLEIRTLRVISLRVLPSCFSLSVYTLIQP